MSLSELFEKLRKRNISIALQDDNIRINSDEPTVPDDLLSEIRIQKQEILQYLKRNSELASLPEISPAQNAKGYVLSSAQRRLWILSQIDAANNAYNMSRSCAFQGVLQYELLEKSFTVLIERHEILRTVFKQNEFGEVFQYVLRREDVQFPLSLKKIEAGKENELAEFIYETTSAPFDISEGPLLRAGLAILDNGQCILSLAIHHIVSDGISVDLMVNEMLVLYDRFSRNQHVDVSQLRIQYKDYAVWQQHCLEQGLLEEHKRYWLSQFSGYASVLTLPSSKIRPAVKTYNGSNVIKQIETSAAQQLKTLVQECGATLFMGLLGLVNIALYRYSGQRDIVVGSPVAGRPNTELENQLGFYVNTLALRCKVDPEGTFINFLRSIKELTLSAFKYQDYPFDELVNELRLRKDISRHPLFDVMVVLQNTEIPNSDSRMQTSHEHGRKTSTSKFDLLFDFKDTGRDIVMFIEYNTDVFESGFIENLGDHFCQLVHAVLSNANHSIGQLQYLSGGELHKIQNVFNDTVVIYKERETVIDLIQQQSERSPEDIALVSKNRSLTYKEVNDLANQLARKIASTGIVEPGDYISVILDRSEWSAIAMIAIMKLGCIYVPIDKALPMSRIAYIVKESGSVLVITDDKNVIFDDSVLVLKDYDQIQDFDSYNITLKIPKEDQSSFVIYTSGSTGKPKGVEQTHRTLYNLVKWDIDGARLRKHQQHLQFSSFSFDSSIHDIYYALSTGGTIHIIDEDLRQDLWSLKEYVLKAEIGTLSMPYAALNAFFNEIPIVELREHKISEIISTGEQLYVSGGLREFLKRYPEVMLFNFYGPSETHVVTGCVYSYALGDIPEKASIGKPIFNTWIYILDEFLNIVPIGVEGEIYIGGMNLAKGYKGQLHLTAERFINDPFKAGEKVYKTGDIAKWYADGNIEYLMRKDNQVKINGFRIELEEIEIQLRKYAGISDSLVITSGADGDKELVAYYTATKKIERWELKAFLSEHLPEYMVPKFYVAVTSIPLTTNGKADKRALPSHLEGALSGKTYTAPRNEVERRLVEIWSTILGIDKGKIGVFDNFFDLGGHSLKITRLLSQIVKTCEVRLAFKDIFVNGVLEDQAKRITEASKTRHVAIAPAPFREHYSLSSSQKRLWVLSKFDDASAIYNIPCVHVFQGALDSDKLQRCFGQLIDRHEIFRTVFLEDDEDDVRQHVRPAADIKFELEYRDVRGTGEIDARVASNVSSLVLQPFDLASGPLLRATLIHFDTEKYCLCMVMHHIVTDGWSMELILKELLASYIRLDEGKILPLKIQYKDYAEWQQSQLTSEGFASHRMFWVLLFSEEPPLLRLPFEKARPALKTYSGKVVNGYIDEDLTTRFKALCQATNSSLFMGLLAWINTLLYHYSGQHDIVIGTPVAGRQHVDLEDQIGCYVNTLPLRTRFKGDDSFLSLLSFVKDLAVEAYDHQAYPFDELINDLNIPKDLSRHPLFDVMLVLREVAHDPQKDDQPPGMIVHQYHGNQQFFSKFDLSFNFQQIGERLMYNVEFNADCFSKHDVEKFCEHMKILLASIVAAPESAIAYLEIIDAQEREIVQSKFTPPIIPYPQSVTLIDLFKSQVAKTPNDISISDRDLHLTFQEVDKLSDKVAYELIANGVMHETFVPMIMSRSKEMFVALLGILKAGAAYVPIDPITPQARVDYILSDTNAKVVVTDISSSSSLDVSSKRIILVEDAMASKENTSDPVVSRCLPDHLAYVVYTSGTTGNPKGVMVEHQTVVNLVYAQRDYFNISSGERILQFSNYTFDASVEQIFLAFTFGATLVVLPEVVMQDMTLFKKYIADQKITHLHGSPSFLMQLDEIPDSLLRMVAGGEVCPGTLAARWRGKVPFINEYGPTETTVTAIEYQAKETDPDHKPLLIGKPLPNTEVLILNEAGVLCPIGVFGELCIGGAQVTRGYLNLPSLTEERFVKSPFSRTRDKNMYKTGDVGRWLPDGNIEFLGRFDSQIKLRGYRIEVGEVEYACRKISGIEDAIVIPVQTDDGLALAVYFVGDVILTISAVRDELVKLLPHYMVPERYYRLDTIPHLINGKVDWKKLLSVASESLKIGTNYVAPRNLVEQKLVLIVSVILGLNEFEIGIHDSFFQLGGHSLKATRMVSQIRKQFNVSVELKSIFMEPTIAAIADMINNDTWIKSAPMQENKYDEIKI